MNPDITKVLIVFSSGNIGGAERSLTRMSVHGDKNTTEYFLGTLGSAKEWSNWSRSLGINPITFRNNFYGNLFFSVINILRYVNINKIDILYVCGLKACFIIRILRIFAPKIMIVHGVRWNPASNTLLDIFFRFSEKLLANYTDGWITNSITAKHTLIKLCGLHSKKISAIHNGIDIETCEEYSLLDKSLNVLTVANLNARKGHIEFIPVIKKVVKSIPNVKFIFVGRDDMNGKLQAEIQKLGLSEVVRYDGYQSDLSSWYSSARIFVLPSKGSEGCPTSILEAHSFGIPVIAYNVDGVPEIVEDTVDGYLYDIDDSSIGQGILRLVSNPMTIESMGMSGREKVKHNFTIQACADNHAKVFMLICR